MLFINPPLEGSFGLPSFTPAINCSIDNNFPFLYFSIFFISSVSFSSSRGFCFTRIKISEISIFIGLDQIFIENLRVFWHKEGPLKKG